MTDFEVDVVGSEIFDNLEKMNLVNDVYLNEMDEMDDELKEDIMDLKYERNKNLLKLFHNSLKKKEFNKALGYVYLMDNNDCIKGKKKIFNFYVVIKFVVVKVL